MIEFERTAEGFDKDMQLIFLTREYLKRQRFGSHRQQEIEKSRSLNSSDQLDELDSSRKGETNSTRKSTSEVSVGTGIFSLSSTSTRMGNVSARRRRSPSGRRSRKISDFSTRAKRMDHGMEGISPTHIVQRAYESNRPAWLLETLLSYCFLPYHVIDGIMKKSELMCVCLYVCVFRRRCCCSIFICFLSLHFITLLLQKKATSTTG